MVTTLIQDPSCEAVADGDARGAWADLRLTINRLMSHTQLPHIIFGASEFIWWWRRHLGLADDDTWTVYCPTKLPARQACFLGGLACWMLLHEWWLAEGHYDAMVGSPLDIFEQFGQSRLLQSLLLQRSFDEAWEPEPLDPVSVASVAERPPDGNVDQGSLPALRSLAWDVVGAAGWGLFSLASRLRGALLLYLQKRGLPTEGPALTSLVGRLDDPAARGSHAISEASYALAHAVSNATAMTSSWNDIALVARRAQAVVSAWAREKVLAVGWSQAVMLMLLLDDKWRLLDALDRHFLPGIVMLTLPKAVVDAKSLAGPDDGTPAMLRAQSRRCGLPHCRGLFGVSSVRRGNWALNSQSAPLPDGRLAEHWRCSVAMRILRRRTFYSDNIRAQCALHCNRVVINALWRLGQRAAAAGPTAPRVRFVDVGASIGDCALAAAALVPEGHLQGLALEADPEAVALLRESLLLNGLGSSRVNASTFAVRHAVVGGPSDAPRPRFSRLGVWLDERDARAAAACGSGTPPPQEAGRPSPRLQLPFTTLDRELRGWGHVDLLHVQVYGKELAVLRGAAQLLRGGRVRCAHVVANEALCPGNTDAIKAFFRTFDYVAVNLPRGVLPGAWVLAWPSGAEEGMAECAGPNAASIVEGGRAVLEAGQGMLRASD